jgi:hypothetical protein
MRSRGTTMLSQGFHLSPHKHGPSQAEVYSQLELRAAAFGLSTIVGRRHAKKAVSELAARMGLPSRVIDWIEEVKAR